MLTYIKSILGQWSSINFDFDFLQLIQAGARLLLQTPRDNFDVVIVDAFKALQVLFGAKQIQFVHLPNLFQAA